VFNPLQSGTEEPNSDQQHVAPRTEGQLDTAREIKDLTEKIEALEKQLGALVEAKRSER